ncbi:MAG: tyrosine-protein phosphatase [Acetobacteraceae bacterium]|nr:tyrosine-protein phosphatase [Acetobacteraceae bacterium]
MDTRYRGDIVSAAGRRNAWLDALFIDHAVFRLAWTNFSTVVPGRFYRSNHPTPAKLALFARRHGIRTLLNLRGQCGNGADALSREAARRLHMQFVDIPLQSSRAPPRALVLDLVAAIRNSPEPILAHCKSGADRAGFAAAVFLLLNGASVADAMRQLSLRYGHLRHSRTGILDRFFERFAADGESRVAFDVWVATRYDPATLPAGVPTRPIARVLNDHVLRRE